MKDFAISPAALTTNAPGNVDRALVHHRLADLERRIGRVEAFILGVLCNIALSVLGGLVALLNLPRP